MRFLSLCASSLILAVALAGCGQASQAPSQPAATTPGERYGLLAVQAKPAITGFSQTPLKIEAGGQGVLTVQAQDAGGGPLTYRWKALRGQVVGTGPKVTYVADPLAQPGTLDDTVTVTVTNRRGLEATKAFPVDTFIGTTVALRASDALQWAPAKTAYLPLSGTVTLEAAGYFSVYSAVIAEYSTQQGRQLALLKPGSTVLHGVTGNLFMYLIGPTEATPHITVAASAGGKLVQRTITSANVVASHHEGFQPLTSPGGGGYFVDLTTAKNGPYPYQTLLDISSVRITGQPGLENQGQVTYSLLKPGSFVFGFDPRISDAADERIVLTDSVGGTGDNTGAWRLDDMVFDN